MDDDAKRPIGPGAVEFGVSVLNSIVGDYLVARGNPLAIEMGFYDRDERLTLSREALEKACPNAGERIVVLVHGLSCNESCFRFPLDPSRSYGTMLEASLGFTPYYVRYNSGLRISINGRGLALLLEELVAAHPVAVTEITLIGHSMGGLVVRGACHYGGELGHRWIDRTARAFYLGSPHHGAPLEKVGNAVTAALGMIDEPVTQLVRKVIDLRSVGIKDLRYGSVADEDWHLVDPDEVLTDRRVHVPLCATMDHFVIAGTVTGDPRHVVAQLFGDAMVRVPSATGRVPTDGRGPHFPGEHVDVLPGLHHMALAHHDDVYELLLRRCSERTA